MSMTLAAEWHVDEPRLRVAEADARAALRAIAGRPVRAGSQAPGGRG